MNTHLLNSGLHPKVAMALFHRSYCGWKLHPNSLSWWTPFFVEHHWYGSTQWRNPSTPRWQRRLVQWVHDWHWRLARWSYFRAIRKAGL